MARFKDARWNLTDVGNGNVESWEQAAIAVLMDIRDELKQLNAVFACPNFKEVPRVLREIRRNTTKPRKPRVK